MHHRSGKSSRLNDVQPIPDFSTREGAAMANLELERLGAAIAAKTTVTQKPASASAPVSPGAAPEPPPVPPVLNLKVAAAHNGVLAAPEVTKFDFRDTPSVKFSLSASGKTLLVQAKSEAAAGGGIVVTHQGGAAFDAAIINFFDSPSVTFDVALNTPGVPGNINVTATATAAALPAGVIHQTMRYNGTAWESSGRLLNYDSTNLGGGVVRMTALAGDNVPQLYIDSAVNTSQPLKISGATLLPAAAITNTRTGLTVDSSVTTGIAATGVTHAITATTTAASGIGVLATASGATAIAVQAIANGSSGKGISASTGTGKAIVASANTGRALEATNGSTSNPAAYIANSGSGLNAVAVRANVQTGTGIYSDASDGTPLFCVNNSPANPTAYFKNDGSTTATKVVDVDAQGMFGIYIDNTYTGTAFEPKALWAQCNNEGGTAVVASNASGLALFASSQGASNTTALYAEAGNGTAGAFTNNGITGAATVNISSTLATSLALNVQGSVEVSNGNINITNYALQIDNNDVVGPRIGGWVAPTGTATRSAFDTSTVTLSELAERVKALIDDLRTHGLIGN